ncbi:hypothetical protein FD723_40360 (plasmid) [Nostoc sp. C052]|uniref:hypothetical protein n=1 Tax=Nostoc sp. C052 TaxID=2576902 RepID=UPI0015C368A3|nr:hypothetical protein [Nostoc sp. C052]QLE46468.1 hypothetical protein FD723_40360 [Nostoc sp. C052]
MKQPELTESKANNLIKFIMGVEIIRRYDPDAEMAVNHGFIYVGDYNLSYSKMMELDKAKMKALGWVEGDKAWAFFVPG